MEDNELLQTLLRVSGWVFNGHEWVKAGEGNIIYTRSALPDWLHSVDAALALPWPANKDMEINIDGNNNTVWWNNPPGEEYPIRGEGTALARALCEVFAAWAVAQEAKEGER